jgi:Terminase small subunit
LRNKPAVKARINELLEEFAETAALKVEYLQAQILPTLRTNTQDLFDDDGHLKPITSLPRETASAVKAVKFDKQTGNVIEVVLADKIGAAITLLKRVGVIRDGQSGYTWPGRDRCRLLGGSPQQRPTGRRPG